MNISKYLKETLKYALRSYPFIKKYVKEIEQMYSMSPSELQKQKASHNYERRCKTICR